MSRTKRGLLLGAVVAMAFGSAMPPVAGADGHTAPPSGAGQWLKAVSCVSATSCVAAGETDLRAKSASATGYLPVGETWNGSKWTLRPVTTKVAEDYGPLSGISCLSLASCVAVGRDGTPTVNAGSQIEQWNGTKWTANTEPNPPGHGYDAFMTSTSCQSICIAVGTYQPETRALVESRIGTKWVVEPVVHGGIGNELNSVSCPSRHFCMAVGDGYRNNGSTKIGIAVEWNGKAWTLMSMPSPAGSTWIQLNSVSCLSPSWCNAVGPNDAGGQLIYHWNGVRWTIATLAALAGTAAVLYGISCMTSASCVAVGLDYMNVRSSRTLAIQWNGHSWTIMSSPDPTDGNANVLSSVSCWSATGCMATGENLIILNSNTVEAAIAMRWNGSSWTLLATPAV